MSVKKSFWRVTSAAAVFSIAAATLVGCSLQQEPEDIVKAYLEAVRDGDADKALKLIDPGVDEAQRVLLTNAVLEGAGDIENIVVVRDENGQLETDYPEMGEGVRTVVARYDVDGKAAQQTFSAGESSDGWTVSGGYETIEFPLSRWATDFTVNGVAVATAMGDSERLTLFPGAYTVELAGGDHVTMDPIAHVAGTEVEYDIQVAGSAQEALDDYATEFLGSCFEADRTVRDGGCPNWVRLGSEGIGSVRWTLDTAPEYDLEYLPAAAGGPDISIMEVTPFAATVVYSWADAMSFLTGIKHDEKTVDGQALIAFDLVDDRLVFATDIDHPRYYEFNAMPEYH